jgi:hypothetical protein
MKSKSKRKRDLYNNHQKMLRNTKKYMMKIYNGLTCRSFTHTLHITFFDGTVIMSKYALVIKKRIKEWKQWDEDNIVYFIFIEHLPPFFEPREWISEIKYTKNKNEKTK